MVVLLTFVAGLTISVILDRHAQATLAEARTIANYQDHHEQQGLRNLVGILIQFKAASTADRAADRAADNQTLERVLVTEAGRRIIVRITDDHGRILSDPTTSGGSVMTTAADILRRQYPDAEKRFLRNRGPGRVSINSAPEAVLTAILTAIDPEGPAQAFAAAVVKARLEKPLAAEDIGRLLKNVGVDDEVQALAIRSFTHESTLSRVQVEVRDRSGKVLGRHVGLISNAGARATVSTNWTFLSFDRVDSFDVDAEAAPRR